MKTKIIRISLGLVLGLVSASHVLGQSGSADNAAQKSVLEPPAIDALQKMGAYLRTLKAFQVKATITTENVLEDGQKLQVNTVTDLLVQRPNRLRAEVSSDHQDRTYYYDGQTFTLWARRLNFYAVAQAPATIGELADRLDEKFGIELPLVDLFRWEEKSAAESGIISAIEVGPALINDASCTHYAYRQTGLDWQIWIQNGEYRLPRKLVLTSKTDEARPQTTITYTWNLAPAYNEIAFSFTPAASAVQIPLLSAGE